MFVHINSGVLLGSAHRRSFVLSPLCEQQMLAMGRTLMGRPRILLLDEPSMGLSPIFVQEIFRIIRKINASGTSILLVEQNAQMALSVAARAYVIENGAISMSGANSELLKSGEVQKAYLGG